MPCAPVAVCRSISNSDQQLCMKLDDQCYQGADKSLVRPTNQCILFHGENISFDASLVIYIHIYIYIYK